jgi:hypothetical protein
VLVSGPLSSVEQASVFKSDAEDAVHFPFLFAVNFEGRRGVVMLAGERVGGSFAEVFGVEDRSDSDSRGEVECKGVASAFEDTERACVLFSEFAAGAAQVPVFSRHPNRVSNIEVDRSAFLVGLSNVLGLGLFHAFASPCPGLMQILKPFCSFAGTE